MLARTRVMFGIGADYVRPLTRCLLRDPTLRGFAQATQDARAGRLAADGGQSRVDFAREADLGPIRVRAHPQCPRPDWRRPLEILLTGATGFLGAHLLSELLASTSARVWCLVRARDAAHARQRIADAAARYDLGGAGDRVVPLPGDPAAPTDPRPAPDIDLPLDFVPADTCAAAIRHISAVEGAAGHTYHLAGS